jgi:fructose-1,6-bisphosphatase/inositol monophosphatase family enzyme
MSTLDDTYTLSIIEWVYNIDMTTTLTQHLIVMATNAIALIQKEAATFVAKQKIGYDGLNTDLITTADIAAQNMYQQYIETEFPEEGIIGEESLNKIAVNYKYFTIDPLDGTKAFGRKQSNNVGTACVGDVNTGELYYFGPDQHPTRKRFGVESLLDTPICQTGDELATMYVSLRKHTEEYPCLVQDLVNKNRGGIFKDISIENGSIGIQFTRLWKGEVGMIIMNQLLKLLGI